MTEKPVKTTPKLRFPKFMGDWEQRRIGEVTRFKRGFDLPSDQRRPGKYPIISSGGHTGNHNEFKVKGPGIVTGRYGSIGEIFFVKEDHWPLNTSLWVEEFFGNEIHFAYQFLQNVRFDILSDKTGVPGVNRNDLHKLYVSIPALPEQQKIADFLTAVGLRIGQLIQKKALLEDYKKGVMQQIFTQAIRFKDDHGNDFPDWEEKKAKDCFSRHSNKNHKSDLPILSASQEHGMVPREDNGIQIQATAQSVASYKVVEVGDFVISLRSFQGGIEYSKTKGICSPAYTIMKASIPADGHFYRHFFKTDSFIQRLSNTVVGIRDGKQISYDAFGTLIIPVPSVPEQTKIADCLSSIDRKIESVATQITDTQTFKKGLLQQMFV